MSPENNTYSGLSRVNILFFLKNFAQKAAGICASFEYSSLKQGYNLSTLFCSVCSLPLFIHLFNQVLAIDLNSKVTLSALST